jgi:Bifunctional DNA primase/polymerase, N-terminal/Primase C terminal 1 (PriCT-1)
MLRAAALALAQKGMAVFPCQPRDKRPATANGLRDATTEPVIIKRWWRSNSDFNVAIATGTIPGIFVGDVDGVDAEAELRKLEAAHGALPPTVEAITSRGRHIYFRMPPKIDVRNSAGRIAPGIDIRGTGGFVVAPPSVHPSGRRYCWSVDTADAPADAPDWFLAKITAAHGKSNGSTPPSGWRALIKGVGEGARDCSVARIAGYLLRLRVDPLVVLQLLQSWNATCCTPPLPEKDIARIVNSIAGKELRRRDRR